MSRQANTRRALTTEVTVIRTENTAPSTADSEDIPHGCYRGLVFIGHLVEEDGEEVEVFVAVPCRRCSDKV